jgi:hypothetical protein
MESTAVWPYCFNALIETDEAVMDWCLHCEVKLDVAFRTDGHEQFLRQPIID